MTRNGLFKNSSSTSRNRFNILTEPSFTRRGPQPAAQNGRAVRRGEVGKDLAEIGRLEGSGFVMSGSRNARMNALREMQEAEENKQRDRVAGKEEREEAIVEHFRNILLNKRKESGVGGANGGSAG